MRRIDHVVLGTDGKNVFTVEGDPGTQPWFMRAHVPVEQAIRTPVEQSDEKLLAVNQSVGQQQELERQQELMREPSDPSRSRPARTM